MTNTAYDKVGVEAVVGAAHHLPTTIIRYPCVYGPYDGQRRLYYAKRMADGRTVIPMPESLGRWHWPHVFSENAAHAVALAATDPKAIGRIYNVAEAPVPTWEERVLLLGQAMEWKGNVVLVAEEAVPEHLRDEESLKAVPGFIAMPDYGQDYEIDSTRIRKELGYREVVSVEEGFRRTLDWVLKNPPRIIPEYYDYSAEDRVIAQAHRVSA